MESQLLLKPTVSANPRSALLLHYTTGMFWSTSHGKATNNFKLINGTSSRTGWGRRVPIKESEEERQAAFTSQPLNTIMTPTEHKQLDKFAFDSKIWG